jgi:chlorobactene glucosyltransferase
MSWLLPALLLAVSLFLAGLLLISLDNLRALRQLDSYAAPAGLDWPMVSILLPARDEARTVSACVTSLLAQRYPRFELLVLDDHSTDATPAILGRLAARDARLRVLAGQPLPAGWLGKHWACQQLADQARGELLLFTDADTLHHSDALRHAVAALLAEQADLVSVLPRQTLRSWGERLVVPLLPWSLASFYPHRLSARRVLGVSQLPLALTMAVGQFMLFRREAYVRGGGHAAVRANVVDDIALARALTRQGGRCRLLDAGGLVTCRMYRSFAEASQGFSKNLFAAFDYRAPALVAVWLWLCLAYTLPWLALAAPTRGGPGDWLALLAAALGLATWALPVWRFRLPWQTVLLSPLIVLLGAGLALRSWRLTRAGTATWKGRPLPAH